MEIYSLFTVPNQVSIWVIIRQQKLDFSYIKQLISLSWKKTDFFPAGGLTSHFFNVECAPRSRGVISSAGRAPPLQGGGSAVRSRHHPPTSTLTFEPCYEQLINFRFCGPVVQLVRMPACHAGGREFESRPVRHFLYTLHALLICIVFHTASFSFPFLCHHSYFQETSYERKIFLASGQVDRWESPARLLRSILGSLMYGGVISANGYTLFDL